MGVTFESCHTVLGPIWVRRGRSSSWKFFCWLLHKTKATESSHRMMEGRGAALMIPNDIICERVASPRVLGVIIGVWSLHVDRYRWMMTQGCRPIDSVLWWLPANPAQYADAPDRGGNSSDVWSHWIGNIPLYSTVQGNIGVGHHRRIFRVVCVCTRVI